MLLSIVSQNLRISKLLLVMASGEDSQVGLIITLALFLEKIPEAVSFGTIMVHNKVTTRSKV